MPVFIPLVVAIVASVAASLITDKITGRSAQIKKQTELAERREALAEQQQQAQLAQQTALATKQARQHQAQLANAEASSGALFSSSAIGAQQAVASNLRNSIDFANKTGVLSSMDTALKQQQLAIQGSIQQGSIFDGVGGAIAGAIDKKGIADALSNIFSSPDISVGELQGTAASSVDTGIDGASGSEGDIDFFGG